MKAAKKVLNQNPVKMNTICQDLLHIKPTLWFKWVMTSQGTGKGLWKFLPLKTQVRDQKLSGWWRHLLVSSHLWSGKFLLWDHKEENLKDCQRKLPWLEPQSLGDRWPFHSLSHIKTDYTTKPYIFSLFWLYSCKLCEVHDFGTFGADASRKTETVHANWKCYDQMEVEEHACVHLWCCHRPELDGH